MKTYDIYFTKEARDKLSGVPKQWKQKDFIKPELLNEYGMCYPLIYDVISLFRLYGQKDADGKIDSVIKYITTDAFHEKIADGYG